VSSGILICAITLMILFFFSHLRRIAEAINRVAAELKTIRELAERGRR
jgi:hypothetical protein